MGKKHSEKEKTSLDSPSPKFSKPLYKPNLTSFAKTSDWLVIHGWTTLFGRSGQALKSSTYVDFGAGQLTSVN